jgi:molecular chaperone HscB
VTTCPKCQQPVPGLLCGSCGTILPPRAIDPFAALGVERRFDLDLAALEGRFRELSRKLHPDRFVRAPADERVRSLAAATTLNESYRTLRDPMARARALLAAEGVSIGENESVDPELVMEVMELREEVEDAAAENDPARLDAIRASVTARRDAALGGLPAQFAGGQLGAAKAAVISIRYFDRLLEAAAPRAAQGAV